MSFVENSLKMAKAAGATPPPAQLPAANRQTPGGLANASEAVLTGQGLSLRSPTLQLDFGAIRQAGLMASESYAGRHAYEYRSLKYALIGVTGAKASGVGQAATLVAVTSALPGDGKTSTSFNLAHSFASTDDRAVILVDADLAKRHLTRALGVAEQPGLADLIFKNELSLSDVLIPTSVTGLFFLPAGRTRKGGDELLGTTRASWVIEHLRDLGGRFTVVFDTSPLLLTNEATLLAGQMSHVVLVVRAGCTLLDAAREARARLGESVPVSAVLNAWEPLGLSEKDYCRRYDSYYNK